VALEPFELFMLGHPLADAIRDHRDRVSDYVALFADAAADITPAMFHATSGAIEAMHAGLQQILDRYDAMICPTLADTCTPAEGVADAHANLMHKALTYPFNLLSRHPILAAPSGLARNGVPTGVQIVGPTFDEHTVLRIGAAIEKQLPWTFPSL
jgi:Asp-tRNA(Asn)/Glu-tRNA(Gln) amidotransferase A subunit family amidase